MTNLPNNALDITARLAKTMWVVLIRVDGKTTLAMDAALNKPWRGQGLFGKKMGDTIVADLKTKGFVAETRTWSDALDILLKEAGGKDSLEQALYDRMIKRHQQQSDQHKL